MLRGALLRVRGSRRTSGRTSRTSSRGARRLPRLLRTMSERQGSGVSGGNGKPAGEQDASKKDAPTEDFDIDMDDPETEKAAVAIQSQFRKFQKKKQGAKS
ncbi:Purkinje cell protein 4-like isoform X2 [Arapaima gigas]